MCVFVCMWFSGAARFNYEITLELEYNLNALLWGDICLLCLCVGFAFASTFEIVRHTIANRCVRANGCESEVLTSGQRKEWVCIDRQELHTHLYLV